MAGRIPQKEKSEVPTHSQYLKARTAEFGIVTQGLGQSEKTVKAIPQRK